jgi:hypothetical protein
MERNQVFYGLGRLYNREGNELIRYKGEIYEYNGRKFGICYRAGMGIIELSTGLSIISVHTHLKGYEEAKKYIEKHYKELESKLDSEEFAESKKEYQTLLKKVIEGS